MSVPKGLRGVVVKRKDGRLQTLEEALKEQGEVRSLGNDLKHEIEEMLKDPKALQDACYQFLMEHKDFRIIGFGVGEITAELLAQYVKEGHPLGLRYLNGYKKVLERVLEWLR